jgi:hypothetical protein
MRHRKVQAGKEGYKGKRVFMFSKRALAVDGVFGKGAASFWKSVIVCCLFDYVSTVEGLDGKTGLVSGLVPGFQGWKYPGALAQPCCELKSLKFILSDSNFLCPPALNTLVTLGIYPSVNQDGGWKRVPHACPKLQLTC